MSIRNTHRRVVWLTLALLLGLLWPAATSQASENPHAGAVYTLTNATAANGGNAVIAFHRAGDGALTPAGTFPTGGAGTGSGLGSQGALALAEGGRLLFAVNAGSDDVSVLRAGADGLRLVDRVRSGGSRPISLTLHGRHLYVLNAGGSGNITGFVVSEHGRLSPLAGSTRTLGGDASDPAQVSFSPDGGRLVVTEKATKAIASYTIGRDGLASGPLLQPSVGAVPFGFDFGRHGTLVVSEASGGVSSYAPAAGGGYTVVSGAVPTHQVAACWLVVTDSGRYAYTANAGSGSISGFRIDHGGALSPLNADGITGVTGPGSHPIDLSLSHGSRYLYAVVNASGGVAGFAVGPDGGLRGLGTFSGVPASAAGLVAT
jgi:6-phosphogluconolactonase (cycloisomerase 2 family)